MLTKKQVERIVWTWQKRLGLESWDLSLNWDEPCGDDAHATTTRSNLYDRAEIRLDVGWRKWSRAFANQIIVHELMHLLSRDVEESFKLAEPAGMVEKVQTRAIEQLVDRMAYRLVEIGGLV